MLTIGDDDGIFIICPLKKALLAGVISKFIFSYAVGQDGIQ